MQKLALALLGVSLAFAAMLAVATDASAMEDPPTWENLALPAAGHDLVIDESRGVAYVSFPTLNQVGVIDLATGQLMRTIDLTGQPRGMHLSASNDTLYVALYSNGSVAFVDLDTDAIDVIVIDEDTIGSSRVWDVFEVDNDRFLVVAAGGFPSMVLVDQSADTQTIVASDRTFPGAPTFLGSDGAFVYVGEDLSPNSLYKIDLLDPAMPLVAEDDHGSVMGAQLGRLSVDGTKVYLPNQTVRTSDLQVLEGAPPGGSGFPAPRPDGTQVYYAGVAGTAVVDVASNTVVGFARSACDSKNSFNGTSVVATDDNFLLLTDGKVCAPSVSDCALTMTVATRQELEAAVACFNLQAPAGSHTIDLAGSVIHAGLWISQSDPAIGLTIRGNGHTLSNGELAQIINASYGTIRFESVVLNQALPTSYNELIRSLSRGTIVLSNVALEGNLNVLGDLTVLYSSVYGAEHVGVKFTDGNLFVRSSVIANNGGAGLELGNNVDAFVTDSWIFGNEGDGVTMAGDSLLNINDSTIDSNGQTGLNLRGGRAILVNDTVVGNAGTGVAAASSDVRVSHSTFWSNRKSLTASGVPIDVESSVFLNEQNGALRNCHGSISLVNSLSIGGTCGTGGTQLDPSAFATFGTFGDHGCVPAIETPSGCPFTMELLPGNPALGFGDCSDVPLGFDENDELRRFNLFTDQRHEPRDATSCDAGSFELNEEGAPPPIAIVSPTDGSVLDCGATTLSWTGPLNGVYAVHAGSYAGAADYVSGSVSSALTFEMTGLPEDGSPVHVRLWFQPTGGSWSWMDVATYTSCGAPVEIAIVSPVDGAVLACGATTLSWTGGVNGVYAVHAGSYAGAADYVSGSSGSALSFEMTGLPEDGSPVFVRLWFQANGGSWELMDTATYTACGAPVDIAIVSPVDEAVLACGAITLSWTGGVNGVYAVHAGSYAGAADYVSGSSGSTLSYEMTGLPEDGSPVFVRLWFQANGGSWELMDTATYTACGAPVDVAIVSPVDEAVLACGAITLTWTGGVNGVYAVHAGSYAGAADFVFASAGSALSYEMTGLPEDGSPVFVRLWFLPTGGAWELADTAIYTACTGV